MFGLVDEKVLMYVKLCFVFVGAHTYVTMASCTLHVNLVAVQDCLTPCRSESFSVCAWGPVRSSQREQRLMSRLVPDALS